MSRKIEELCRAARSKGRLVSSAMEDGLSDPTMTVEAARAVLANAPPNPHQPLDEAGRAAALADMDGLFEASHGRSMTDDERGRFDDLIARLDARKETAPRLPEPDPPPERRIPRVTAAAIAKACVEAGVPELTAQLFESNVSSTEEVTDRIFDAVAAKKILSFTPRQPDPAIARPSVTAATLKEDMRVQLERDGALEDWSFMEKAG